MLLFLEAFLVVACEASISVQFSAFRILNAHEMSVKQRKTHRWKCLLAGYSCGEKRKSGFLMRVQGRKPSNPL